ncbi:MAG: O-antigen ligase family protein [Hyphomicrobium sp.]
MLARMLNALHRSTGRVQARSFAHTAALALVWLTFALSGLVFSEPCPTDVLALALIVLLPVMGLVRVTPLLGLFLLVWAAVAATGLVSATFAADTAKAVTHTLVSFFLAGSAFTFAAFIAHRPAENIKLILNGFTVAALAAGLTGIAGYFSLIPDAEMFTKFGRAAGTFKDPNVFGPFLVPSVLYAIHTALQRPLKKTLTPLALAGVLALAVFLSFSRGAWINLIVSLAIYLGLAFLTAASNGRRQKIAFLSVSGAAMIASVVGVSLQDESVARLVTERASVAQSYDVGPEGRFGGQEKATGLILEHPLGIGAAQFAPYYHHEEAHNVYLSMAMATGWLGSGLYIAAVLATLGLGILQSFKRTPWQPLVLIAVAAFAANAAEGIIIDSDHWRHFYVLMAIIWGGAAAEQRAAHPASTLAPARRATRPVRIGAPAGTA